jgi:lysozyme
MWGRRGGGFALLGALAATLVLAPSALAGEPRIPGIDVSRFQGEIGWTRMAAESDVGFAFIQASRGKGPDCAVASDRCGPDEWYDENYLQAKAAGIRVGPYHRAFTGGHGRRTAKLDARREAQVFIQSVGSLEPTDLRPALDVETPFGGLNPKQLRLWVRAWLRKVERAFGVKPIIYTNSSSWGALGQTPEFALAGHPLWVAHWHVRAPLVPAGDWAGYSWTIWQHASDGRVPGVSGNVDLNWLRGGMGPVMVGGAGGAPFD